MRALAQDMFSACLDKLINKIIRTRACCIHFSHSTALVLSIWPSLRVDVAGEETAN